MLNAIIIDDNKSNIEMLQQLIEQFCHSVNVIGTATEVEQGYLLINKLHPDIVFLDVELNEDTGFDLLRMFRTFFFRIIFTTAYSQYAVDAFREHAIDYLLKPINIRHLQEAITKAEEGLSKSNNGRFENIHPEAKISLPTQEGYLFVNYNDIIRCEASGSYSEVYLLNGNKMLISMRLKECEDLLPSNVFCRVHNSHIVNINFVKKYIRGKTGQIILSNNETIDISVTRKDNFMKLIRKF